MAGFSYRNIAMLREVTPRLFLVYMFMSVSNPLRAFY